MTGVFERLKESCAIEWQAYTGHRFVQGMGNGTLPVAAFEHYLKQDYLFLIQFARAYSLAGYKARTLADLKRAKDGVAAIIDIELSLHVEYCRKWGISEEELAELPEATATMAYTRYVLECGMAGDLLDLHVALAPCMLGYGEIGLALDSNPKIAKEENPYYDWIAMYAGDEYQAACRDEKAYLDQLAGEDISSARFARLSRVFKEATRLEIGFWQMGIDQSL